MKNKNKKKHLRLFSCFVRAYCVSTARVSIILFCSLSLFHCIVFRGGSIFDGLSIHLISQVNTKSIRRMAGSSFFFISLKEKMFSSCKVDRKRKKRKKSLLFFSLWLFSRCYIVIYTSQLDGLTCHPISGFVKGNVSLFPCLLSESHCRRMEL